jgi:uncharacterized protein involved in response to NO
LLGAAYAGLGILIWLPLWFGDIKMPAAFSPLGWHIHEMLCGHVAAVMTGFLLTAIPTGPDGCHCRAVHWRRWRLCGSSGVLRFACSSRLGHWRRPSLPPGIQLR